MSSVPQRPVARIAPRALALGAALTLTIPLIGSAFGASSAEALPLPDLTVTATAEIARPSVYTQTDAGTWMQGGAVDPTRDRLYIADSGKDDLPKLTVLNLQTGTPSVIPLDGGSYAIDVAVSPLDGAVYVVQNTSEGFVSVVDPAHSYSATDLPPLVAVGSNPQKVEVGADGRAYVSNLNSGTVSVLGRANGPDRLNVVQTIADVQTSGATSAIDNERNLLFIASEYEQAVTIIDTATTPATVRGSFPVDFAPTGVAVDPRSGAVVLVTPDDNTVSWFSSTDGWSTAGLDRVETLGTVTANQLKPISVDVRPDGTALAVTQVSPYSSKSIVSVVPTSVTPSTPVRVIPVGSIAFWGVLDPQEGGSFYVPNAGNGNISVISDVTLAASATPAQFGQESQAEVSLTRADGYPVSATVTVSDATQAVLGSGALTAAGTASIGLGSRAVGTLPFTATVQTAAGFSLSASGVSTTAQAPTSTVVTVAPEALTEGDSATVSVVVAGAHGTVPTGTVTVKRGATVVGTATLQNGAGSVALPTLVAGDSQITASYAGDDAHLASDSAEVPLSVQARTATGVLDEPTGTIGAKKTIAVTGYAPNERVTFTLHSDPIELGSIVVDGTGSGSFTFTVPEVAPGTHTIVAVGETSGRTTSTELVISGAVVTPEPGVTPPSGEEPETPGTVTSGSGSGSGTGSGSLATTGGSESGTAVVGAMMLLAAGAALLVWRRVRRTAAG